MTIKPDTENKRVYSLCEAVADIAIIATKYGYSRGNSREEIANYIQWAQEFEAVGISDESDYVQEIEKFAMMKISEGDPNFTLYKEAGTYLSSDNIKEAVENIIYEYTEDFEGTFIDDVDGVDVWEPLTYRYTCLQFLTEIGFFNLLKTEQNEKS